MQAHRKLGNILGGDGYQEAIGLDRGDRMPLVGPYEEREGIGRVALAGKALFRVRIHNVENIFYGGGGVDMSEAAEIEHVHDFDPATARVEGDLGILEVVAEEVGNGFGQLYNSRLLRAVF